MSTSAASNDDVQIHYVDVDGKLHELRASVGETLMRVATGNLVRGIDGDCGGNCACGTCLIELEDRIAKQLCEPGKDERELLNFLGRKTPNFRLGCQIALTRDLDGMTAIVSKP